MKRQPRVYIWQSEEDDRWYWTVEAANHQPTARCAEDGYPTKSSCRRAFRAAQEHMLRAVEVS